MERFTVGIVVFPSSNCDRDVSWALEACLDIKTKYLWHEFLDLGDLDAIVLPEVLVMVIIYDVEQLQDSLH